MKNLSLKKIILFPIYFNITTVVMTIINKSSLDLYAHTIIV